MPLTEKGQHIKRAMQETYGPEKGESVFYASKNKGTIEGVDCGWRPTSFSKDAMTGQTAQPIRSAPTTVGRAGQQMGQDPGLNSPAPPNAGGFRDPGLVESGNPRVPIKPFPSDQWAPPKFDIQPHPPIDPIAEACEFAAGITSDPNKSEAAASKNDHAAAQVFHERMARFHQSRHEDDKAAAHMAASGAHQQAARTAGDKGYRRGVTLDQVSQNARECSVKANYDSGFGRGFGKEGWPAPDWSSAPGSEADGPKAGPGGTSSGHTTGAGTIGRISGGGRDQSQGTGRYQLVDRQTGDCFDVNVPDHVQFSKDAGAEALGTQTLKPQPLKSQTIQPQTLRGTQNDHGWASPQFNDAGSAGARVADVLNAFGGTGKARDAGTSQGAQKAAQTRQSGGGGQPAAGGGAPAAPKPAAAPKPLAAPKPIAGPKPVAAPKPMAGPKPAPAPAMPKPATAPRPAQPAAAPHPPTPAAHGEGGGREGGFGGALQKGAELLNKGREGVERVSQFAEEYGSPERGLR